VDAYFTAVAVESVAPAARLFVGEVFPTTGSGTPRIKWEIVVDAIQGLVRVGSSGLRRRCATLGDIGSVAAEVFAGRLPSGIAMSGVARWANDLVAATDPDVQRRLVADMLARLSSLEARYIVQLIVGELQIGLDPADVEAAVAARHASSDGQRRPDRRRKGRA
jgi:DNA ligase-1